jgi:hypothetical protein
MERPIQTAPAGREFMMLKPKAIKQILEKGMGPGIVNVV